MNTRTSDLAGGLLDYWVARAVGYPANQVMAIAAGSGAGLCVVSDEPFDDSRGNREIRSYSSDWTHGGPIIERERIATWFRGTWHAGYGITDHPDEWKLGTALQALHEQQGETLLIAAMRTFVASRFGLAVLV